MGHGVAGHEQLKAVQPGDEVVFYIAAPGALHVAEAGVVNMLDDFREKGAGAGCRVKDLDAVDFLFFGFGDGFCLLPAAFFQGLHLYIYRGFGGVCQPVGNAELAFENVVHGSHDKVDHRLRGVPNAPALAQLWVVLRQKGFVKMDNRVVLLGGLAKILQQGFYVGCPETSARLSTVMRMRSSISYPAIY